MSESRFAQYLGDGVYADWDGMHIVLTTGDHRRALAANVICLDRETMQALQTYLPKLAEMLKK